MKSAECCAPRYAKSVVAIPSILLACLLLLASDTSHAIAQQRSEVLPLEVSGQTLPLQEVEIVPPIDGVVVQRNFELGQRVEKGDVLIKLDPKPYSLKKNLTKIKLKNARFELDTIRKELDRVKGLVDRKLMKRTGLYDLVLAHEIAQGGVEEAEADLEKAEFELSQTVIKSPIDGYVSRVNVDVGDFVSPSQGLGDLDRGQMLEILNYVPIRVVVGVEQSLELRLYQEEFDGEDLSFALELPTGAKYPHRGKLVGSYHRADPETGNINYELLFPNPDRLLVPGVKVKVRITEKTSDD